MRIATLKLSRKQFATDTALPSRCSYTKHDCKQNKESVPENARDTCEVRSEFLRPQLLAYVLMNLCFVLPLLSFSR